jgi:hypothetical protein
VTSPLARTGSSQRDGQLFVLNITFRPPVIVALRPHTNKIFDCHLMIESCDPYLDAFAKAGADVIIVHTEATTNLDRSLREIRALGRKPPKSRQRVPPCRQQRRQALGGPPRASLSKVRVGRPAAAVEGGPRGFFPAFVKLPVASRFCHGKAIPLILHAVSARNSHRVVLSLKDFAAFAVKAKQIARGQDFR